MLGMGIERLEHSSLSACQGELSCLAATGQIFDSNMKAFEETFIRSEARDAAGTNKPFDCQPYDLAVRSSTLLGTVRTYPRPEVKKIDDTCQ